jgi:iron complex transport system substrate-binding protein
MCVGALLLGACGDDADTADAEADTGDVEAQGTEASDGEFPVTIEHVYGETTIDAAPARVAAVEWGNADVALALGVVPVGMPAQDYGDEDGNGIHPWAEDALADLGVDEGEVTLFVESDGLDYEQVAASRPDVIISSYSGLEQEEYDLLSDIAPTVAYPEEAWTTSWRDMALMNGRAMGMESEAEDVVAALEDRIAAKNDEHPEMDGRTFIFGNIDDETSSINVFNDARVDLLEEFGMVRAPSVEDEIEASDEHYASFSFENVDQLESDVLVLYGDEDTLERLQSDPLLARIPAVQTGAVAVIIDGSPMAAAIGGVTVLSLDWVLDDYYELFADAAAAAAEG